MRIGIVHISLNPMGGAERLCLATIEALKEHGWEVILITSEATDWYRLARVWGSIIRPDKEIILSVPFKGFTIYKRLLFSLLISTLKREFDSIVNTHGDILVTNADITYMHFPTFALWNTSYNKYKHGFWRLYFTPYYLIHKRMVKKHLKSLLLTNSRFSASVIRKMFNRRPLVVYPPVDIDKYIVLDGKRENNITTIGRFSPEKRYEFIVKVAEKLPQYQFYIIGSVADTEESKKYYGKIKTIIEEKGLKNIKLLPNVPENKMLDILSSSKIYLHAMINEHFGIAVVEGMASGLIPVVHRSGGTWTDVVEYGKYGYGYTNLEEAVTCIKRAIKRYNELKFRIRYRSLFFSKKLFKKKIIRLVESYAILAKNNY